MVVDFEIIGVSPQNINTEEDNEDFVIIQPVHNGKFSIQTIRKIVFAFYDSSCLIRDIRNYHLFHFQNVLRNLTQGLESLQLIRTITILIRTDAYSFGMLGVEETEIGKLFNMYLNCMKVSCVTSNRIEY